LLAGPVVYFTGATLRFHRNTTPPDLNPDRPVAIEFQFVEPVRPLGEPLGAEEQHRWDECRFGLRECHGRLQNTQEFGRAEVTRVWPHPTPPTARQRCHHRGRVLYTRFRKNMFDDLDRDWDRERLAVRGRSTSYGAARHRSAVIGRCLRSWIWVHRPCNTRAKRTEDAQESFGEVGGSQVAQYAAEDRNG